MATADQIERGAQFSDTPSGWASRWQVELDAARERLKKWHESSEKIIDRYLDNRSGSAKSDSRLNLFTSNIDIQEAMLFGKTPKVDVSRRFADNSDSVARVAAECLERMLNTDLQRETDSYQSALENALHDRLVCGLGNIRLRYVPKFKTVPETPAQVDPATGAEVAPAVPEREELDSEDVETDYVYWRDQLWSPARTFADVRWWAFCCPMTRDDLEAAFGADGKILPLNSKRGSRATTESDALKADPWGRCEVWEIWDKEHRRVWWFVDGFDRVLKHKDNPEGRDPLGLENFWPFPKPLVARMSTSAFVPCPDYKIAQDLYLEIDDLTTRIRLLEKAIAVRGVYDRGCEGLKSLLNAAASNELVAVDNWAMFAEKGGIKGAVDWLPLEMIVSAMDKLRELRSEAISQLFQVSGLSDIMRGQAQTAGVTATEQAIKARFGGVRIQRQQDSFARFASDAQRIRAEIISKHFSPQTIIERSNVMFTPDRQAAQQAVALIKSEFPSYRIEVKPENVSLTDYAALRQERTEFVQALSGFLQAMVPAVQLMPPALPYLLESLKWVMAGFKGSSQIEGVMDQAIAAAQRAGQAPPQQQPQAPPPPDPRVQQEAMRQQGAQAKIRGELQADLARIQAETQADLVRQRGQFQVSAAEELLRREGAMPPVVGLR